jgi:hypothetical protein
MPTIMSQHQEQHVEANTSPERTPYTAAFLTFNPYGVGELVFDFKDPQRTETECTEAARMFHVGCARSKIPMPQKHPLLVHVPLPPRGLRIHTEENGSFGLDFTRKIEATEFNESIGNVRIEKVRNKLYRVYLEDRKTEEN